MAFTPFVPQGFSPQQLQQAYMNGQPPSQCQTIAIICAYANPNAQVALWCGRLPSAHSLPGYTIISSHVPSLP